MHGLIFDIQKFSIHDGPGIRTTVFLKGCPLRCRWCHNPESNRASPELSFTPERCIGCGYCFEHCPRHLHTLVNGEHRFERSACTACGQCAQGCYADALEMIGRQVTVEEVIEEVLRDKPFYDTSGGGMTLSGGEPLLQPDFTAALLERAREWHLHCCVETAGCCPFEALERITPFVDLFLYDIKETDNERHIQFTGRPNTGILENLHRLHGMGAPILLRLPIIPGANDTREHFEGVASLTAKLPKLQNVEIMPYHRLGEGKLNRLGLDERERVTADTPTPTMINGWIDRLAALGVTVINDRRAQY